MLSPTIRAILMATVSGMMFSSAAPQNTSSSSQHGSKTNVNSSNLLVIQGRVTALNGDIATIKVPDAYPHGPGIRAQIVVAGPSLRVNVSRARVLMPDGRRTDDVPLAVGDRVVMVSTGLDARSSASHSTEGLLDNGNEIHFASVIERLDSSDKSTANE